MIYRNRSFNKLRKAPILKTERENQKILKAREYEYLFSFNIYHKYITSDEYNDEEEGEEEEIKSEYLKDIKNEFI